MPHDQIKMLQQIMHHGGDQVFDVVPNLIKNVIGDRSWEGRTDQRGRPFPSFEAFVQHRYWEGLQSSIDDLLVFCRKREDVACLIRGEVGAMPAHGEIGGGHGRGSNTTSANDDRGATYALRRLKRDRPDLAEKVVAGELSANAAAIEAGFRKKPTPLDQLRRAWAKASNAERAEFLDEIGHDPASHS